MMLQLFNTFWDSFIKTLSVGVLIGILISLIAIQKVLWQIANNLLDIKNVTQTKQLHEKYRDHRNE